MPDEFGGMLKWRIRYPDGCVITTGRAEDVAAAWACGGIVTAFWDYEDCA